MSTTIAKFDVTGTYYACVVERPGKKELQIHPLQKDDEDISINSSLSVTFELESSEPLVSVEWVSKEDVANGKRSKRRSSSGVSNGTKTLSYVVCAYKNGTIVTYSPFQQEPVNQFKTQLSVRAITSLKGSLWISGATESVEHDINDASSKLKVKYPKDLKNITCIEAVSIKNKDHIISIGNKIVVQECATGKVVASVALDNKVEHATCIDGALFVSSLEQIRVYGLPELKQIHMIYAKGPITGLAAASDSSAGSVLSTGQVQIYKNIFEKLKVLTIRPNTKDVRFNSAYFKDETAILSWPDIEPKFQSVNTNTTEKSIKVDVKHTTKSSTKKTNKPVELFVPEIKPKEQYVVRDVELAGLIGVKAEKPVELLTILISNPEEDKIKTAVPQLEDETAVRVYRTLQSRITSDPAESATLNSWLKWVVISHPTSIQSLNNFKPIKTSIKKSLKQLPDLLALQGRLELLQSQLGLRNQIKSDEVAEGVDTAVAQAEESIVYVNGEDDEEAVVELSDDDEEGDEDNN
ncbi:CYFA0S16e00760g1_1 [Cyberlindnera fabianii]|uniref:CYFA0S16e00760g1_1 n=1 Tax=Cyberlindnera fabianii TaxID=36022 RepID=A0A061BAR8_CYBFA|nr:U3 small nucleolar RNA-associated protein 9 [Cyberlindnera fabianii]CDR44982.1 CYFA0S16e00760g1_1 [Cyberlindnera fabianii]